MGFLQRLFGGSSPKQRRAAKPKVNTRTDVAVLTGALGYPDPDIRSKAEMECQRRAQKLWPLLGNPTAEMRRKAAEELGTLKRGATPKSLDQLVGLASEDADPNVRASALTSVILILTDSLKNEGLTQGRISAAEALGNIVDPRAVDALIEALEDGNGYVKSAAATSLGNLRDKRGVPALIKVIKDEAHYGIGKEALEALKRIGDLDGIEAAAALGLMARDGETERLVEQAVCLHFDPRRLHKRDANFEEIQREYEAAWEQIRGRNDPALVRLLVLKAPGDYRDRREQPEFGEMLGTLGAAAVPALCGVLADRTRFGLGQMRVAVIALVKIGDPRAVAALRKLSTSCSNSNVREEAAKAVETLESR